MSQIDNVVPLRLVASNDTPAPPPEADPEVLTEEMSLLEASIVNLAMFLLDNKRQIKNFVCGITCFDKNDPQDGDEAFHLVTSPIDVADYALSLRLLEDGFNRHRFSMRVTTYEDDEEDIEE